MKTQTIPMPLKDFHKVFLTLGYRHDIDRAFCDLIDLSVAFFKANGDAELGQKLRNYYKEDYDILCKCFAELIKAYDKGLGDFDADAHDDYSWYDAVGVYYEIISSSYKSSVLGQFFTPQTLCDVIAQITIGEIKKDRPTFHDGACGSGRLLLAGNKIQRNGAYYGTDIDPICVKMTAINMALHGMRGQVVCANSFCYGSSWRFGYEVNADLYKRGVPSLIDLKQEDCYQSKVLIKNDVENSDKVSFEATVAPDKNLHSVKKIEIKKKERKALVTGQLELF